MRRERRACAPGEESRCAGRGGPVRAVVTVPASARTHGAAHGEASPSADCGRGLRVGRCCGQRMEGSQSVSVCGGRRRGLRMGSADRDRRSFLQWQAPMSQWLHRRMRSAAAPRGGSGGPGRRRCAVQSADTLRTLLVHNPCARCAQGEESRWGESGRCRPALTPAGPVSTRAGARASFQLYWRLLLAPFIGKKVPALFAPLLANHTARLGAKRGYDKLTDNSESPKSFIIQA